MWLEILGATGGWATVILAVMTFMHGRRTAVFKELREELDQLRHQLFDERQAAAKEHEAMRVQIADMRLAFAASYVHKEDFGGAIRGISEQLVEIRKENGAVHNRIDKLLERVEWRRVRDADG